PLPPSSTLFPYTTLFRSLLAVSVPLPAHHGAAGYDMDKQLTMKGTVREWLWANPHCFMKYDATDEKGNVAHWAVEVSNVDWPTADRKSTRLNSSHVKISY